MSLYFAYGGNTNPFHMLKAYPEAQKVTICTLADFELCFRSHLITYKEPAYCDLNAQTGSTTFGVLYTVTTDDIYRLDKQEMLDEMYERIQVQVTDVLDNQKRYNCFTYKMIHSDLPYNMCSQRYYTIVSTGYKYHALPLQQLNNAYENAYETTKST